MVSFLSLPWNGRDPVSISNCGQMRAALQLDHTQGTGWGAEP